MGDFRTSKQLLEGALKRAGEVPNSNSRHFEDTLTMMNEVYIDILSGASKYKLHFGKAWTWAREAEPLFLTLKPKIEDTLTFTKGSTSGTFSAIQTDSLAGRHIKMDSRDEMYRIKTHVAGTNAFTLETARPARMSAIGTSIMPAPSSTNILISLGPNFLNKPI